MRITNYRIELDDEDRRTVLVKECAKNYPGINTFNTPSSTYKMICDVFHADRLAEEHVWILCLDTKLHLIGQRVLDRAGDAPRVKLLLDRCTRNLYKNMFVRSCSFHNCTQSSFR